mgnify:CR=1 FL=1
MGNCYLCNHKNVIKMKYSCFMMISILTIVSISAQNEIEYDNYDEYEILEPVNDFSLEEYKNKILLVVNVASYCGLTFQYKGLEKLYNKYKAQGFEIAGFPCNQFALQEPGTNEQIKNFCDTNYGITFKIFNKIRNGKSYFC